MFSTRHTSIIHVHFLIFPVCWGQVGKGLILFFLIFLSFIFPFPHHPLLYLYPLKFLELVPKLRAPWSGQGQFCSYISSHFPVLADLQKNVCWRWSFDSNSEFFLLNSGPLLSRSCCTGWEGEKPATPRDLSVVQKFYCASEDELGSM